LSTAFQVTLLTNRQPYLKRELNGVKDTLDHTRCQSFLSTESCCASQIIPVLFRYWHTVSM